MRLEGTITRRVRSLQSGLIFVGCDYFLTYFSNASGPNSIQLGADHVVRLIFIPLCGCACLS